MIHFIKSEISFIVKSFNFYLNFPNFFLCINIRIVSTVVLNLLINDKLNVYDENEIVFKNPK